MPGNLKRPQAEPAIGTVNTDLSRTQAPADPRFVRDDEALPPPDATGLSASGGKVVAKTPSLPSDLAGYPRNKPAFVATPRKRT
jgi:hypothetical protein